MKNTYFLLFITCFLQNSLAQGEKDWWYFGLNAGLHFVNNVPIPQTNGQLNTNEGCATISDANGNLLFYTDGITVWNKNHTVMQNGTGLKGDPSSTMSSMCIPLPGSPNLYYIFTTPAKGEDGLYYSVVDINANNGNGTILLAKKNVQLMTKTCEKVTAVKNTNGTGYWVLAHTFFSDEYYAYQLTSTGLSMMPTVSQGQSYAFSNGLDAIGYMKFSPDGTIMAVAHTYLINDGILQLYYFNATSGALTGWFQLFTLGFLPYGVEFSTDSRFLYYGTIAERSSIHQMDLVNYTPPFPSSYLVHEDTVHTLGSMQLGPDDKIYISVKDDSTLDRINFPEQSGIACNYQKAAVQLGRNAYLSLPNFVQGIFIPPTLADNQVCPGDTIHLFGAVVPQANSYEWASDNGFSATQTNVNIPNANASLAGNYYFSAYHLNGTLLFRDTISVTVFPIFEENRLDTFCNGTNYILPNGSSTNLAGWHKVILTSIHGCDSVINVLLYKKTPIINLGSDKKICEGDSITFTAPNGYNIYRWNGNSALNQSTFTALQLGTYWVEVQDNEGCWGSDSIAIQEFLPTPQNFLPQDSAICKGENETIRLRITGFSAYLWGNGSTSSVFTIQDTGTYTLQVKNSVGCWGKDEIYIREACPLEIYIPNAFSPNRDGNNDVFFVTGQGIDDLTLTIFDRWGRIIIILNNPTMTWDGKVEGKDAPEGVYTYKIIAHSSRGQSLERGGTITLIR